MQVGRFVFRYQGNGATPCQYLDTTRKAIDCATTLSLTFLYTETLQQTFRPLLSKLSKRRQIQVIQPHFEEVRGGVEPWLIARWKVCVEFLLSVIERLFLPLAVEALYKAKCVKTRCLQEWVGHLEPKFQGKGLSLGNIFWFLQNQTHFAIQQCKLHRVSCRRFDTIRACDGRTDGIAVANTSLAMRALRRAVKITSTSCLTDLSIPELSILGSSG